MLGRLHLLPKFSRIRTQVNYIFLSLSKKIFHKKKRFSLSKKTTVVVSIGIFLGLFLVWFFLLRGDGAQAWYNDGWAYRKKLTIDHTKVSGDANLTDFPVLISLTSDTHLSSNAQADGDDIIFTDSIGNQLAHEIESYSSGTLVAWVRVPILYGTQNTDIYMYYGNSSVTSQENSTGVWADNYQAVWHLSESSDGSVAVTRQDSSANSNTLSDQDTLASATGKIGASTVFDNATTDDLRILIGNQSSNFPGKSGADMSAGYTFSTWAKFTHYNGGHTHNLAVHGMEVFHGYVTSNTFQGDFGGSIPSSSASSVTSTSEWYYLTTTWDGTQFQTYINGDASGTPVSRSSFPTSSNTFYLGTRGSSSTTRSLGGYLDEVRLQNRYRSPDWIATEYTNQNSPSTFYTTGYQEERTRGPSAYWKFDEGYGTGVNDSSENELAGTLGTGSSAPTWKSDEYCVSGKCLQFDGTGDYVQRADNAVLDIENELTISLWIKPTALQSSTYYTLVYKGNSTNEANYYLQLYGDELNFGNYESGNWRGTTTTNANMQVNQWSHIAVTYSNSSDDIDFYVNGLLKTDNGINHDLVISGNNQPFYLGSSAAELEFYEGFMDEVKIYPYVRSADEIKQDYLFASAKGSSVVLGATDNSFLSQGLVGYWNMEGIGATGSGQTVADRSGNGNDGTTSDANGSGLNCISAGKYGGGCDFDGTDDSVNLGSGTTLDDLATDKFSVQAWVYLDTAPASNDDQVVIISKGDNTDFKWHLSVRNNSGSTQYNATLNNVAVSRSANTTIVAGWHHVIMTYNDDTDRQIRIYVDGSEVSYATQIAMNGSYSSDASKNLRIGSHANETSYWDGKIDEVRIYNRELSATEVRSLYQWAPGPVAYWDMDESSGSNANDKSGNGNTGSLQGSSSWVTGKYGGGVNFNGSGDYISAGSDTTVDDFFDGGGTVSFWVYPRSAGENGFGRFLHKSNSTSIWATGSGSGMDILMWQGFDTSGSTRWTFDNVMTEDTWNYISLTYDNSSTTNDPSLYVNGIKKTLSAESTPPVGTRTSNASSTLVLGSNGSNADSDSILDEFRIYNYIRTQEQILEDMNAGHPAVGTPVGSAIFHYKFDEGYGDRANDIGPNFYHGDLGESDTTCPSASVDCPTWSNDGKFGKALLFDGVDDVVETSSSSSVRNKDEFSISVWIKPNVLNGNRRTIYEEARNQDYSSRVKLAIDTDNKLYFAGRDDDGDGLLTTWVDSTTALAADTWYHVVAVYSATTDVHSIYINGVEESASVAVNTIDDTAPYELPRIGARNQPGSFEGFGGIIDEIALYPFSLTSDQVKLLYKGGKMMVLGAQSTGVGGSSPSNSSDRSYCIPGDTSTCSSPVLEMNFEEGTGTTAYDTSTNGNNGTINGATWGLGPDHMAGSALEFDGSNDYVEKDVQLVSSYPFTISGWIKTTDPGWNTMVSLTDASAGDVLYVLDTVSGGGNAGKARIMARNTTETGTVGTTVVIDGEWHHITGVFASDTQRDLYVDGVLEATGTTSVLYSSAVDRVSIGRDGDSSPGDYFGGSIDQVRVYNYARTPAQIAWEYSKGAPIAHYRLDECQSTTAYNSAFNPSGAAGNNGTINAGSSGNTSVGTCASGSSTEMWANGASGQWGASLDFDETDDRVVIPDMDLGQEFTVSFWFNSDDNTGTGYQYMYSHGTIQTANSLNIYFNEDSNAINTPGTILVSVMDGDDGIPLLSQDVQTQVGLSDSSWHHLVVTITSTGTKGYVDGIQQISYTNGNGGVNPSGDIYIGARNDLNSLRFYDGKLDDIRIYNYPLTTTQIKELYNGGAVTFK